MAPKNNSNIKSGSDIGSARSNRKHNWVWIALAATVGASIWISLGEESAEESQIVSDRAVQTRANQSKQNNLPVPTPIERDSALEWQRPIIRNEPQPIFGSAQDEAADMEVQPESPPQAPPLPFVYAGKLVEDGTYTIFLLSGERSFAAHPGDVIEDVWQLKTFDPPEIVFDYLPLKIETVMNIGEGIE